VVTQEDIMTWYWLNCNKVPTALCTQISLADRAVVKVGSELCPHRAHLQTG
jgi:hypothetical protein